eukprot:GFYU01009076.1.p1 GENE.GFYU01009076.1~~GFYU01009076.1.p1  ORF type:complete len:422 (-),score=111.33 GFYU01009076.1:391-1656(-)
MSASYEELKELVSQTLESKGVLAKMRAQLRASVFTAIDEETEGQGVYMENSTTKRIASEKDAPLMFDLIREFLEYFDLDYTTSVLVSEGRLNDAHPGRRALERKVGVAGDVAADRPLLLEVFSMFQRYQDNTDLPRPSSGSGTAGTLGLGGLGSGGGISMHSVSGGDSTSPGTGSRPSIPQIGLHNIKTHLGKPENLQHPTSPRSPKGPPSPPSLSPRAATFPHHHQHQTSGPAPTTPTSNTTTTAAKGADSPDLDQLDEEMYSTVRRVRPTSAVSTSEVDINLGGSTAASDSGKPTDSKRADESFGDSLGSESLNKELTEVERKISEYEEQLKKPNAPSPSPAAALDKSGDEHYMSGDFESDSDIAEEIASMSGADSPVPAGMGEHSFDVDTTDRSASGDSWKMEDLDYLEEVKPVNPYA